MNILRSNYKLLLLLPFLVLMISADRIGCGGALPFGGANAVLTKVALTRATVDITIPADFLDAEGELFCVDVTNTEDTWDNEKAVSCGTTPTTPDTVQTVTLKGLWPDRQYLARLYPLDVAEPLFDVTPLKATLDEKSEPVSNDLLVNTNLVIVKSEELTNMIGFQCVKADFNADGITDVVCGGSTDSSPGGTVALHYMTGQIPEQDGFPVVKLLGSRQVDGDTWNDYNLGSCLAAGDLNGDKIPDLVIGASRSWTQAPKGHAYILWGPITLAPGSYKLEDVRNQDITGAVQAEFGTDCALMKLGGVTYLGISAPGDTRAADPCLNGNKCGGLYLYLYDPVSRKMGVPGDLVFTDGGPGYARSEKFRGGDFNGNGTLDLAYVDDANMDTTYCRHVSIMADPSPGAPSLTSIPLYQQTPLNQGTANCAEFFLMDVYDVNGDGFDDFIMYELQLGATIPWKVTIVLGNADLDTSKLIVFDISKDPEAANEIWAFLNFGDMNYDDGNEIALMADKGAYFYPISTGGTLGAFQAKTSSLTGVGAATEEWTGDHYPDFVRVSYDLDTGIAQIMFAR